VNRRTAAVVLAGTLLLGCTSVKVEKPAPVAQTSEQVANVFVSAYPEIPWSDISAALVPNRGWKITDAQNVAVNTTAAQSSLVSTLLAGGLAITLPSKSTSATPTAATVPTAPSPTAAPPLPGVLSLGATAPALSPVDGADLLVTSTALFQEAVIIDNQITKQYAPLGYTAHLLTFQINLQPLRRDWSYDAFVDITLVPSPWATAVQNSNWAHGEQAGLPAVIVKPLIITDALETTSIQNSIQQIQEALFQLSGAVSGAGAAGSLGSASNVQHQVAGYDKNSLVTAGRVSDATIRVRLGAESIAGTRPALVPRTYNISLFVLTKTWDPADPYSKADPTVPKAVNQLAALTNTYFMPSDGSSVSKDVPDQDFYLKSSFYRSRPQLAERVSGIVNKYGYPSAKKGCGDGRTYNTSDRDGDNEGVPNDLDATLDLLRAVDRADYLTVQRCLGLKDRLTPSEEQKLLFFIADMSEIQASARHSILSVPLKDTTPRLPDPGQFVLVSDSVDGTQEILSLRGGSNLNIDHVYPRAKFSLADGTTAWLLPISKAFTYTPNSVPELDITFAAPTTLSSLKTSGMASSAAPSSGIISSVELVMGIDSSADCNSPTHACYMHLARVAASSSSKPGQPGPSSCPASAKPITTTSTILRPAYSAATGYSATLNIVVGDIPSVLSACAHPTVQPVGISQGTAIVPPLSLMVSGADVAPPSGSCLAQSANQIQFGATGKCVNTLTLTNLSAESPVTLSVVDSKSTTVGQPISIRVVEVVQKP
jgi:hypothetical protein